MSSHLNSTIIAAALGATVAVVAAAASIIYNNIQRRNEQQQEHTTMQSKIQNLNQIVSSLKEEVDHLLELQSQQKVKRRRKRMQPKGNNSVVSNEFETDIETCSTAETDIGEDEFYDCSDLDDDVESLKGAMNGSRDDLVFLTLDKLDELSEDESKRDYVYDSLNALLQNNPTNVEVVWRFARACYHCTEDLTGAERKKTLFKQGLSACEKILETTTGSMNLYKWYAILTGCQSQLLPTKEKISNAYRYKEYVEKALDLEPSDGLLHHLLGRFKYEVSELSWLERKLAATLFSEPPSATYEDALKHFEQAEKLYKEPHLENKLFLSKCYISMGRNREACDHLRTLLTLSPSSDKERKAQEEAQFLLTKHE